MVSSSADVTAGACPLAASNGSIGRMRANTRILPCAAAGGGGAASHRQGCAASRLAALDGTCYIWCKQWQPKLIL